MGWASLSKRWKGGIIAAGIYLFLAIIIVLVLSGGLEGMGLAFATLPVAIILFNYFNIDPEHFPGNIISLLIMTLLFFFIGYFIGWILEKKEVEK